MNKKKVILIGCGDRGKTYTDIMKEQFDNDFEVVAVADLIDDRRNYAMKKHNIPKSMCFDSWKPLLEMDKFADLAIIATSDRGHYEPAMAAIAKGYNLMLEKPIAPTARECREIQKAAEEKGVFVLVCHVLRYTRFFTAIKSIIDSGEIGKVRGIQHIEGVGHTHQAHSFVRGNWAKKDESACMILAKTCHDMDMFAWLVGEKCTEVHSFGSLSYFTKENAPEGAADRCIDGCPAAATCPYNAVRFYLEEQNNPRFRAIVTGNPCATEDDVKEALRTNNYGKCVFKCDNDVVDHQTVNLKFGKDVYVDMTMSAFTQGGRAIRIMGTKGEIEAKMKGDEIHVFDFMTRTTRTVNFEGEASSEHINGGHGGGDRGIIHALRELMNGNKLNSVSDIRESCDNHMICFAAEESRLSGKAIKMSDFD